jgi:hypothetical protein
LKVELMIFSGRPNPSFVIGDPAVIRQVVAILEATPPHPTLTASDSVSPGRLGYNGYFVTPTGMNGVESFIVYGNTIEVWPAASSTASPTRSFRFDADAKLEQLLSQLARADAAIGQLAPAAVISVEAGARVVERSITINLGAPIISFVALPARSPITVVAGTRVKLIATIANDAATPVTWVKDSRELATTGRTLELVASSPADSGRYWAIAGLGSPQNTTSEDIELLVTTREGQRLLNLSTLGRVGPEQPVLTSGFTVEAGSNGARTLLLVRAIGPGLAPLGVTSTLRAPQLRVMDSRGLEVAPANVPFALPAVAEATARAGAFTLQANSTDIARLYYVPAGAFTAHVSSTDAGSGAVLLEIFEVPLN